jgi:nitrate/TMAO reductase-like tetraheme cytochrome c subunit
MRKFWQRIRSGLRSFFFPPEGSPRWQRILPYAVLGVLTLIVLSGAVYGWEYTNSPEFCGTACHTMPPEFTSYLTSPHARIDCVDCHIGKGFITTRVTRKAGDIRHIIATTFNTYEFPIRAHQLQPARETCEKCHLPEKFSDDSLREIKQFSPDKDNTPLTTYLVLKTGGGSKREGLGRGIHWHIENQIEYFPADPEEQEIPYVRVLEDDLTYTEYIDIESGIEPGDIDPADLVEMDCTTCHNRITHLVKTPEATVDELMNRGIIDPEIPEIRRMAWRGSLRSPVSTKLITPIITPKTRLRSPGPSEHCERHTARASIPSKTQTGPPIPIISAIPIPRAVSAATVDSI